LNGDIDVFSIPLEESFDCDAILKSVFETETAPETIIFLN